MDNEHEGLSQARISRRTMIKGAGAGAVLVWAAPTVVSMGSAAFAASNRCTSCAACVGPTCSSGSGTPCRCFPLANGTCFCVAPRACGGPGGALACSTDADCAADVAGSRCISSCCGDIGSGGGTCGAPCGSPAAKPAAPGTLTQAG